MSEKILRGDVWWVSLDSTQGSEINKTRPCVILTNNTLNEFRKTIVVIPLSSSSEAHPPITVKVSCQGRSVVAVIDQARAIAKHRLKSKCDKISEIDCRKISTSLAEILELS